MSEIKQRRVLLISLIVLVLAFAPTALAVSIGVLSFDGLIPSEPDSAAPGVNAFITNFTGDPGAGGFALPPDLPATRLPLTNSMLMIDSPT